MAFVYNKAAMDKLIQYADRVFANPFFVKRQNPNKKESLVNIVPKNFYFENTKYNYACAYYDSADNKYTVAVGYWDYLGSFAVSFNGADHVSANVIKHAIESISCPYLAEIVPTDKNYYKGYWYTILLKKCLENYGTTNAETCGADEMSPTRETGATYGFDNANNEDCSMNEEVEIDNWLKPIKQIAEEIKTEIK